MVDLSSYLVTGTNNSAKQVSVTYQNGLVNAIQNGINAASVSGGSGPWVSLADYLDPDRVPFVTDDLPAMQAAIDAIAAIDLGPFTGSSRLLIPPGRYYFSDTPVTNDPIVIEGPLSGQVFGAGALIRFGKNCDGFNLRGAGSKLSSVMLYGGNVNVDGSGNFSSFKAGDSTTGVGVKIGNDFIEVHDVMASFFGEAGFRANADGADEANSFYIVRCQSCFNRGAGFEFYGSDANAGVSIACSAVENGGGGFLDYSFLGNAHYGHHTRDNGITDPTSVGGLAGPVGTCVYLGVYYYVVAGQETAASTTTPGTDSNVWRTFGGHPSCRTWTTGHTWVNGAPYGTNPSNANCYNCKFDNPYAESAQPPVQVFYPAQIHGGLLQEVGQCELSTAPFLQGSNKCFTGPAWKTTQDTSSRYAFLGAPAGLVSPGTFAGYYDGTRTFRIYSDGTNMLFDRGGGTMFEWTGNGINLISGKALYNGDQQVVGARGAALPADATDLATALTLVNAIKARMKATGGHGLVAD